MIKRFALVLLLVFPVVSFSQLRLARIFSDDMVLQRDQPIHFWGTAKPGEKVTVQFGTQQKTGIARPDSVWNIYLNKSKADTVGRSVIIKTAKERFELSNILIGDIWVCSGQSNME